MILKRMWRQYIMGRYERKMVITKHNSSRVYFKPDNIIIFVYI